MAEKQVLECAACEVALEDVTVEGDEDASIARCPKCGVSATHDEIRLEIIQQEAAQGIRAAIERGTRRSKVVKLKKQSPGEQRWRFRIVTVETDDGEPAG